MNAGPIRLPIGLLLVLHVLPGAIATLVYVLLAAPVGSAGYPPLAALLIAIGIVIVPFELGVVLLAAPRTDGPIAPLAAVPYRRPMRRRDWLILVPALLVVAIIGSAIFALVEPSIRDALYGWLPGWFLVPVPLEAITDYPRSAWIVTLVAYFALNGVLGPVTEELYFRGYLLPRMSQLGRWAPLLNVVLFSLYHFWSPWQFFSRIAGVTPVAYAVWWKENVYLGVVVHVLLNTIGVITVMALVVGQLR